MFSWCLDHQFEFIENQDENGDQEDDDGIINILLLPHFHVYNSVYTIIHVSIEF